MYIEIITISSVRFDGEEMFYLLLYGLHVIAFSDVFGIVSVTQEYKVDTTVVSFGSLLQSDDFVFTVLVVILRDGTFCSIILVFQPEYDFSTTSFGSTFGHFVNGQG